MASIRELRIAAGKTMREVARDLDMTERHLARLERGETPLRVILTLAFAAYYSVPAESIDAVKNEAVA